MTPKEQLKIYAAYLPYKTKCYCMGEHDEDNNPFIFEIAGITHDSVEVIQCGTTNITHFEPMEIFPVLYDLSYLTKEIEHEGEIFKPVDLLVKYAGNQEIGSWLYNYNYDKKFNLNTTPYLVVKKLLEWHINIFGIPAGDFIEKATLKTESND